MSVMGYFAEKLKALFQEKGIESPWNYALDLGVDPSVMSKVLNSKMPPTPKFMQALADAEHLDIDFDRLEAWKIIDKHGVEKMEDVARELGYKKNNPPIRGK